MKVASSLLIIGANGGLGALFLEKLQDYYRSIVAIDLHFNNQSLKSLKSLVIFTQANVTQPDLAFLDAIVSAQHILLCTPLDVTLTALNYIFEHAKSGTLIMDVVSVKSPIQNYLHGLRIDIEYMSLHPLFGPEVKFEHQNVVIVSENSTPDLDALGPQSRQFIEILQDLNLNLSYMSAEQHDKQVALIQAASHMALLTLGRCLSASQYSLEDVRNILTPSHRTLLILLARMAQMPAHVYWQIQTENPYAKQARQTLLNELLTLNQSVIDHDRSVLEETFEQLSELLGSELNTFQAECKKMFQISDQA